MNTAHYFCDAKEVLLASAARNMNWEAADSEQSQVWQGKPCSKEEAGP